MSTIVFVHAHPDDEALLTGGTMALLAGRGHRVVLVTATHGEAGLAPRAQGRDLGRVRTAELDVASRVLGCARVENLGYRDSGSSGPVAPGSFADRLVAEPAARLAALLGDERADVVVGYDPAGGYGHRDHRQVHRVTAAAARLAGTPRLLEATVDRRLLQTALRLARPWTRGHPDFRPARFAQRYSPASRITHAVDVRAQLTVKRAAMGAHVSQAGADDEIRTLARFLALPAPVFSMLFGREWYVEPGAGRTRGRRRDLLDPA